MVQLLLSNKADVNKTDADGNTPLTVARSKPDILLLLETYAREKKFLASIKQLVADGVKINEIEFKGNTALGQAVISENMEIVEFLIKCEANVCKKGKNGNTPLLLAVQKGNVEIIKILLKHGANKTIQSSLFEAITSEKVEIIELLVKEGALLDVRYRDGNTPLTKAIEIQNLDIVKILIDSKANVNMPKNDKTCPLSLSLKHNNLEIMKYLINKGARLNDNEKFENFLKHFEGNDLGTIQLFVELGAKLDIIYNDGDTPLTKAVKVECFEIVNYLVQKGVNVNLVNGEGKVPLAIAAAKQDLCTVQFLISANADVNLAKKEIEDFANCDDDFAIYLSMLEKRTDNNQVIALEDSGHEAAD